jgi:hypothetical protein
MYAREANVPYLALYAIEALQAWKAAEARSAALTAGLREAMGLAEWHLVWLDTGTQKKTLDTIVRLRALLAATPAEARIPAANLMSEAELAAFREFLAAEETTVRDNVDLPVQPCEGMNAFDGTYLACDVACVWIALQDLARILALAATPAWTPRPHVLRGAMLQGAIALCRQAFRGDGAEDDSVRAVCDALEAAEPCTVVVADGAGIERARVKVSRLYGQVVTLVLPELITSAIEALCRGESPDPLPDHPAVRAVAKWIERAWSISTAALEVEREAAQERDAARASLVLSRAEANRIADERDAARARVEACRKVIDRSDAAFAAVSQERDADHEALCAERGRVEELVREVAELRGQRDRADALCDLTSRAAGAGERVVDAIAAERDAARAELAKTQARAIKCGHCEHEAATCFGSYEDDDNWAFACDTCCGHGNEDGHCIPLAELGTERLVPRPYAVEPKSERDAALARVGELETSLWNAASALVAERAAHEALRARVGEVEEENRVLREDGHRLRRIEASRGEVIAGLEAALAAGHAAHEALRERVRGMRCQWCDDGRRSCQHCAGTGVHPEARAALEGT